MSATQQRDTVIEALLDQPYRFEFFQAVGLMVAWLHKHGIAPERALTEHILFENVLSFSFAPAQILEVGAGAGRQSWTEHDLAQALAEDAALQVRFTPAFMGFLGVNGTLPFHYTERIYSYQSTTHDEAPRAFLDMFSNRALAQFYLAWRKHRVEHLGTSAGDGFLSLLLNLAGFEPGATLDDEAIARYAGVLMQRPVPPDVLAKVLADYLRVPLVIDESTGGWIALNPPEQCALGRQNAALSSNAMLGERSWRPDLHAEIRIGPLTRQQFDAALPGRDGARGLAALLRIFGNPTVSYDVRLILKAAEITALQLLGGAARTARLGQDSFLVAQEEDQDRADMHYRVTPMDPLPPLPHHGARP